MILHKSAVQEGAFNLAGLLANVSTQNLTKPNIHRSAMMTNDDILEALSGLRILRNPKFFSSFVTSTRTGLFAPVRTREEGFSDITTRGGNHSTGGSFRRSTRVREGEFLESIKKGLLIIANPVYGYSAPAKSGAGRGNPLNIKATQTPIASFFVSCHSAHQFSGNARNVSMVALAGLPKGRPVSFVSGISTPVNVTTPLERGNSGGDSLHTKEAAIMATTPTQNPQFIWLIAAVRRDMPTITAKIHHIAAETEREARRTLARDHVCFFAGRIRLEVAA